MVCYPISVPWKSYRGTNPQRLKKVIRYNEIATLCEKYLNDKIKNNPEEIQQYMYGFIAVDLSLSTDEVRDVMYGVDGGHNGITIRKPAIRSVG